MPQESPVMQSPNNTKFITHKSNIIIRRDKTKQELAQYLHACAFSPSISTFLSAIRKGHFLTWPGLITSLITRHLPPSPFTAKGHMNQEQKHLQSTKKKSYKDALLHTTPSPSPSISTQSPEEDSDFHPTPDSTQPKTHNCFAIILDTSNSNTGYMDLTGRFPYRSSRGYQYLLIIYDYDSNAILVAPLKNRKSETIIEAQVPITFNSYLQKIIEKTLQREPSKHSKTTF